MMHTNSSIQFIKSGGQPEWAVMPPDKWRATNTERHRA